MVKRIAILGSTGSIGTQSLDVISRYPELFSVEGLAAGGNIGLLLEQIRRFEPKIVSVASREKAEEVRRHIHGSIRVVYGEEGLIEVAAGTDADLVITAVVGSKGLKPTLSAIEAGKEIGLANKETLVSAGHLVTRKAQEKGVRLLPVDSEHSAIFQCLNGEPKKGIAKIILTASGGAFRDKTREQLRGVSVEEALAHPNWSMGAKITVDSATMVNKGLEVIEAHWLFEIPYSQIGVLIHPESIVHSMVEFADGSVVAQLGIPDMRIPIQYALTYPHRIPSPVPKLDLAQIGSLRFCPVDFNRFPCLKLAYECGEAGGISPAVFNAANEVAVERFLKGEIDFLKIEEVIYRVVEKHDNIPFPSLEEILLADAWARQLAAKL